MAERERQHYVPQFLLRNFASIEGKNVVNLYNKKHGKKAFNVSITTQAQEKFYYGEDPAFELFFAHVENRIAPDIAKIIEQEKIPELGEKFYAGLVHFIATFAFRTKANVDRVEEGINAAFKEVSKYIDELKDIDWDTHRIKHPEPAAHSVAYYFQTLPV